MGLIAPRDPERGSDQHAQDGPRQLALHQDERRTRDLGAEQDPEEVRDREREVARAARARRTQPAGAAVQATGDDAWPVRRGRPPPGGRRAPSARATSLAGLITGPHPAATYQPEEDRNADHCGHDPDLHLGGRQHHPADDVGRDDQDGAVGDRVAAAPWRSPTPPPRATPCGTIESDERDRPGQGGGASRQQHHRRRRAPAGPGRYVVRGRGRGRPRAPAC